MFRDGTLGHINRNEAASHGRQGALRLERGETAFPRLEHALGGMGAQHMVQSPLETGPTTVRMASSGRGGGGRGGTREAVGGAVNIAGRAVGAVGDLLLTPIHGLVRIPMTMISEMNRAKKMYVGPVVSMISKWKSPWGRVGALLMTPVIAGAAVLTIAQGIIWGGLKGLGGLLKDKAISFVNHLRGEGPTYFELAAQHYNHD